MITDARGPTSWNATPEKRKLRACILAGIEAGMRKRSDLRIGRHMPDETRDYATALGVTREQALARCEAQEVQLAKAAIPHNQPAATPERRPLVNAMGPTSWDATAEGKRLRASILSAINTRMTTGRLTPPHLYSNAAMHHGNRPAPEAKW